MVIEVIYFGYRIDEKGLYLIKENVCVIVEIFIFRNVLEFRSYLGFFNYYGEFLFNLYLVIMFEFF